MAPGGIWRRGKKEERRRVKKRGRGKVGGEKRKREGEQEKEEGRWKGVKRKRKGE